MESFAKYGGCGLMKYLGECHYTDKPSDLCRGVENIPPKDPATAVAIVSTSGECKAHGNVVSRMNDDCSAFMCHLIN